MSYADDQAMYDALKMQPAPELLALKGEERVRAETAELERLQAMDTSAWSEGLRLWHSTAIRDTYWRRRMATRTPEEVARGVVAPG